jgi:uncharacterized protein
VIVLDTSGLLAALDPDQRHHELASRVLQSDPGPFLLSPFILAELDYLLLTKVGARAERALLDEVAGGAYDLVPFDAGHVAEAVAMIGRDEALRIGLADASVAIVAARARTTRLLTLDERHFRAMQPLWGETFHLLPADEP